MGTVATTPTFRIPRGFAQLDNIHFYSGPSDLKPFPKARPRRRDEPSTDSTWTDIDQIVDDVDVTAPKLNLESECEGVLTSTTKRVENLGLLYSGKFGRIEVVDCCSMTPLANV